MKRPHPRDLQRTDRLPVVLPTQRGQARGRTPTRPLPRVPAAAPQPEPRRRRTARELSTAESILALRLEGHLRAGTPDAQLATRLGLTQRALAPYLRRLRRAVATYEATEGDVDLCERLTAALRRNGCRPHRLCDTHLGPLQDYWDARDAVVADLLTAGVRLSRR